VSGPISVTEIGAADCPKPYDYELTLTFKVTQYGSPADPELAVAMNRIFHDWDEGRHPFPVEQVSDGLSRVVKDALYQCCQKRAREKFGNEMIETGPGARTSKAYLEAAKEYDKMRTAGDYPGWCDQPTVKLERKPR